MASLSNLSAFNPTQISGCALWLDAADQATVTLTGSNITNVRDKSPQNLTLSNATGFSYTTNLFNGSYPSFFNPNGGIFGTNNSARLGANASFAVTVPFTVFFVGHDITTTSNYGYVIDSGPSGLNRPYIYNSNINTVFGNGGAIAYARSPFQACAQFYTSPGMFVNGNSIYAGSLASFTTGGITVGNRFSLNESWPGHLCEIIIYSINLTTAQRQQIEGYLAWKWNLQANLPTTHPYYTNPYIANIPIIPLLNPYFQQRNYSLNPRNIAGCALWLDAADQSSVVRTGSNVTSWNDKSGNGRNATPSNSPTYTGSAIDLRNGSRLTGSINIASGTLLTTAFCVAITPATFNLDTNRLLSVWNGVSNDYVSPTGFVYSACTGGALYAYRDVGANITTTVASNTLFMQTTVTFSNGLFVTSLNGNYPNGNSLSVGSNTNSSNTNTLTTYIIGSVNNFASQLWRGLVNEVLIFNRTLSQAEYQQVEGYLAWKWNLQQSLPTAHPYYNNPYIPNLSIPNPIPQIRPLTNVYPFSPTQYSGCVLWLDAADANSVIQSGGAVSQWNDKSGSNNNTTISGTINYSNNNIVCSNSYFFVPVDARKTTTSNFNVFIVYNQFNTTSPSLQGLWGTDIGGGWNRFQLLNYDSLSYMISAGFSNGSAIRYPILQLSNTNRQLYNCSYSLSNVNNSFVYVNGSNVQTFTEVAAQNQTNTQNTYFATIDTTPNRFGSVNFNEILIFRRSINTSERQQIEGYLAWKWGLQKSLPTNHPFYLFPPG